MKRTKRNFWLDVTIFVAFLVTTITGFFLWLVIPHQLEIVFLEFSRSTWVVAHICFGVVGLAGITLHIVWHRDWLKAMRGRPFSEIPKKLRANRVVDRIMWITFIATNGFGAITWVFHYDDLVYLVRMPDRLHVIFSVVFTILMIVHIVFHRKWIAFTIRRCIQINVGLDRELQISNSLEQGSCLPGMQETRFIHRGLLENIKTDEQIE